MIGKVVAAVLTIIGVAFVSGVIMAIPVMLGSGVLHGYWPEIPAFTFWQSFALSWAFSSLFTKVRGDAPN